MLNHPEILDILLRKSIKQGYTKEDAKKDNVVKEFDKIKEELQSTVEVAALAEPGKDNETGKSGTKLPIGFSKEIGDFLGGKRKTKKSRKSKGKKPSKKRTTRKNKK
jgi:hypothetical protein